MAVETKRVSARPKHYAVAMYPTQGELVGAVRELHRLGFINEQITVLAKDHEALTACAETEGVSSREVSDAPDVLGYESEPKGRDEAMGMAIGGAVGVILGLGAVVLPGLGAFLLAAGPAAIALHGLTWGTAGVGMGALLGAIMDEKVTEDHRELYEQELNAGHWLLVVHGEDTEVERARLALESSGARRVDTF